MIKKDFYEGVIDVIDSYYAKLRKEKKKLDDLSSKSMDRKRYTRDHINTVIFPAIRETKDSIEGLKAEGKKAVESLCDEYREELQEADAIKGSEITEDARLFNSGVKLTERDLESMLKRNRTNPTMCQLIFRYADEHKLQLTQKYVGNNDTIAVINALPYTAEVTLKWYEDDRVYNELVGAGSKPWNYFMESEEE